MNDCHSQRARFAARLPSGYRYTSSHFWFVPSSSPNRWRVGMTEFALRMLGELVVVEFEVKPGAPVTKGDTIGLIEGFKALSDLYCIGSGTFEGGNPTFSKGLESLSNDPYDEGWLYEFSGEPEKNSLDASAYADLLGVTLTQIQSRQCSEGTAQ